MGSIFLNFEIIFTYSAKRANPIIWNIFKCCSRSYSTFRISFCRVINPTTYCANVLFHNCLCFMF